MFLMAPQSKFFEQLSHKKNSTQKWDALNHTFEAPAEIGGMTYF